MENEVVTKKKSPILEVVKAVIIALIISLVGVLLAALVIKLFNVPSGAIPIINQVLKGVSVLVACLVSFKIPKNGWVKGIAVGLFYTALAFVIFSLLDGAFKFDLTILNDVAIGCVSGFLSGIITANISK